MITHGFRAVQEKAVAFMLFEGGLENAPQLAGQAEMLVVGRAAKVVVFHHEEDVPLQDGPHEHHEPHRHVGIDVHPRLPGDPPTLPDDVLDRAGRSRARRFRQGR